MIYYTQDSERDDQMRMEGMGTIYRHIVRRRISMILQGRKEKYSDEDGDDNCSQRQAITTSPETPYRLTNRS